MDKHSKSILFLALGISVTSLASCDAVKQNLVTPHNVIYKSKVLRWDPVTNANEYKLKINDEEPITLKNSEYRNFKTDKDFKIELQAFNTSGDYYESDVLKMDFHFFDAPNNFRQEDGCLKWDAVPGCESYDVYDSLTREYYTVEGTEFIDYIDRENHEFYVRANSDNKGNVESKLSSPLNFKSLKSPENLEYDFLNKGIVFDDVNEASSYEVKIDEKVYKVAKLDHFYKYSPDDLEIHEVCVRAISTNKEFASSTFSKPIKLQKLAPLSDEEYVVNIKYIDGIDIGFKDNTFLVDSYVVKLNDGLTYQVTDSIKLPLEFGENKISVSKIAKKNPTSEITYLDSDETILRSARYEKVKNVRLSDDKKYIIWDEVPGATVYYLKYYSLATPYVTYENKIAVNKIDFYSESFNSEFFIYAGGSRKCDLFSEQSVFYLRKLITPENIYFDSSSDVYFLANTDLKNIKFVFNINGKEIIKDKAVINLAHEDADEFDIKVKIINQENKVNDVLVDGDYSKTFHFKRIKPLTNLRIEDSKICFDGKYQYNYKFYAHNETTKEKIGPQYQNDYLLTYSNVKDGDLIGLSVSNGSDVKVSDANKIYDFPSKVVTITEPVKILGKIQNFKVVGRTITWDPVSNATKYLVKVNEHEHIVNENKYVVDISELTSDNSIYVSSLNDEPNTLKSVSYSYGFKSTPISAINQFYKVLVGKDNLELVFEEPIPNENSKKYGMFKDGKDYQEVETHHLVPKDDSGIYKYQFFPINDSLDFYFDKTNSSEAFYYCETPEVTITNNENYYTFSWNQANCSRGYKVILEKYDLQTDQLVDSINKTYDPKKVVTSFELDTSKYYFKFKFQGLVKLVQNNNVWNGLVKEYTIGGKK